MFFFDEAQIEEWKVPGSSPSVSSSLSDVDGAGDGVEHRRQEVLEGAQVVADSSELERRGNFISFLSPNLSLLSLFSPRQPR